MMWDIRFTNVNEVIADLEQIDKGRSLDSMVLCDVVEFLKNEQCRDVVAEWESLANDDCENHDYFSNLFSELKTDIENGDVRFVNTCNWGGKITHDMCYGYYEYHKTVYVVAMFHRYGDVRGNYTDYVVLEFDNEYEWYDAWANTELTVSGFETENGLWIRLWADPFGEWIQWTADGDEGTTDGQTCEFFVCDLIDEIEFEYKEFFECIESEI